MAIAHAEPRPIHTTPPVAAEQRRLVPIKWWAGIGAAFGVLVTYIMVAWITSDDFKRTPTGPDPVPGYMHTLGVVFQIVGPAVVLVMLWFYVVRPWIRERHIAFDGLFLLGFASIYWQDPLVNYMQAWCSYNADLLNMGSWTEQVPGWMSPNGSSFPEPPLFSGAGYMYSLFAGALAACWVMRKAKERWPALGNFGLVMIAWGFIAVFDLIMECVFMRTGLYTYGGAIPELSIGSGHYYQFPIYEAVLWGGIWTVWASLRYFRDDRGHSVVERGVDRLRVGNKRKTVLRFLAIAGVMNASLLVLYSIPWQLFAVHSGPWNKDTTSRSYMMSGLCGPGTSYICAGPDTPLDRGGAIHINRAGQVVPGKPD